MAITSLCKDYRPFVFFGLFALVFFVLGLVVGLPVVYEFFQTSVCHEIPFGAACRGVGMLRYAVHYGCNHS